MTLKLWLLGLCIGLSIGDGIASWLFGTHDATWVLEASVNRAWDFLFVWCYIWFHCRATGYVKL